MRLVLFSDLHLDTPFAWLGVSSAAASVRRDALRQTLRRIAQLAQEVSADALLCGGDLYEHDRVSPDTAAFLRDTFAAIQPLPVYLAPGNHDWYGPYSVYAQVPWSPNVHIFAQPQFQPAALGDGITLWGAAHCAPASNTSFVHNFRVTGDGRHLALFHGSARGWAGDEASAVHVPFDEEDLARSGLDHAFVGHYHRGRAAPHHTYPGNPDPLAFGEDGEHGAVLVGVAADGVLTREWHRVAQTTVRDLMLDVTGCGSQQDVRDRLIALVGSDPAFVRVTLHGDLHPDVTLNERALTAALPSLPGLVVRIGRVYATYDFDELAQERTVRGQFVQNVLTSGLAEDERRRVLITGLRALAERDDLEVR